MVRVIFVVLFLSMIIVECYLVYLCQKHRKTGYEWLSAAISAAAMVTLSYLVSITVKDYQLMSVFTSLYFCANTVTCYFTLRYMMAFTGTEMRKPFTPVLAVTGVLCVADIIIELLNPFFEYAVTYTYEEREIACYSFESFPLYAFHLALCYFLLACSVVQLIVKMLQKPKVYRAKYSTIVIGIFLIVVINGIYLFVPKKNNIDFSVFLYCFICILICYNAISYETSRLLTKVRALILDELGHPVILFDENNHLSTCNEAGEFLIGTSRQDDSLTLSDFLKMNQMDPELNNGNEDFWFQWGTNILGREMTYRIDYHVLKDEKERIIGRLFVFTDTSLEIDVLTGFHSKNTFERYFQNKLLEENRKLYCVAICDLNRLSQINKSLGENVGDSVIALLADLMRKHCPKKSYFARMDDANLLVATSESDTVGMRGIMDEIRAELKECRYQGIALDMQSAICMTTEKSPSVIEAAETAAFSMRSKKLMDGSSMHSSLLDSFAQTLMEEDSTTEAHVKRTKDMGELLGMRLGLTDIQLSNLSLLCLLHDVGKLGIPLEILNKPGKLNDAEWDVMKSHVEKGYRIAKASKELEGIADFILHHHEAWNGRGYPDGLKEESIPILSRIIAVVDSYDAMTNDRPYHKAVSEWEAREELRRCSGTQFDPTIVNAYLELLNELRPVAKPEPAEGSAAETPGNVQVPRGVSLVFGEHRVAGVVNQIPSVRYLLDADNAIIDVNEHFEELTGYSKEDLDIYHIRQDDLLPPEDREQYWDIVARALAKDGYANLEHRIMRKDGSVRTVLCFGKKAYIASNPRAVSEILVNDISTTNIMNEALEKERKTALRNMDRWVETSRRDSLTGVLNHEAFINEVEMQLLNQKNELMLLILDVDNFKIYNDSYGHMAGDKMLTMVAHRLQDACGNAGFAGRLGGDEFVGAVVIPDGADRNRDAMENFCRLEADRIFHAITDVISAAPDPATISMGATLSSDSRRSFPLLYKQSDKNLYEAKERGRNGVWFEAPDAPEDKK